MKWQKNITGFFRSDRPKALGALLFRRKADNTLIQLIRYTFVGGLAFLVDFLLLFGFTEYLSVHYLTSAVLAFMFGLSTNYLLSITWVFSNRRVDRKLFEFMVFLLVGVVGVGLNIFFIWFFTERVQMHYLVSKIFATFLVYFWNFSVRKFTLF